MFQDRFERQLLDRLSAVHYRPEYGDTPGWAVPTVDPRETIMSTPVCDCGTELTRCRGRRRGTFYWWCWKCEKAVKP